MSVTTTSARKPAGTSAPLAGSVLPRRITATTPSASRAHQSRLCLDTSEAALLASACSEDLAGVSTLQFTVLLGRAPMIRRISIAAAASLLVIGIASPLASAQAQKPPEPKGVKVTGLVTSLGGFSATVNTPLLITGSTVELEPGGQTGKQQFRVPTFIYVLEGTLTTNYEAGPVGIMGAQYHAAGQSFMDNGGWWHNHLNSSNKPVKYLMLHLGYPGRPDPVQRPEKDE